KGLRISICETNVPKVSSSGELGIADSSRYPLEILQDTLKAHRTARKSQTLPGVKWFGHKVRFVLPHHVKPIHVHLLQWNPRRDTRCFRCRLLRDGRERARVFQSNTSSGRLSRKQIMETGHPCTHSSLSVCNN